MANEAVGEPFNPWRRFFGVMIPDPIAAASGLSMGAKVCYGLLARFAGKNGDCFPTMQTIGRRIGVSDRQARSYIGELVCGGYIRRTRRGNHTPNRYAFLWHASFVATDGKEAAEQNGRILPPEENQAREKHIDLDCLATHRGMRDPSPEPILGYSTKGWKTLSDLVEGLIGTKLSRSSLGRIVAATPGITGDEALEAIQEAIIRGYGAGKHGPRSVSWFVSVVRNYWADRERRALPPPAGTSMASADFDSMTAALELPDAP
jgi:hypothetical protein